DGAVLRVAARIAVGEAQRALTVRVGKCLGRTRDAVLASDQVLVVSALNGHATGYLAVAGPRGLDPPSRRGGQAGISEEVPGVGRGGTGEVHSERSEEHTSELQSPYDLVCRLLLEKKK